MKKLFLLVSFTILLQSCFSYKSIGYKSIGYQNIEIEKKQKLLVLMVNKTSFKGRLVSKNEKTMILETKGGLGTVSKDEIYDVKVREFSFLKTTGLVVGSVVAIPLGLTLLYLILGGGV